MDALADRTAPLTPTESLPPPVEAEAAPAALVWPGDGLDVAQASRFDACDRHLRRLFDAARLGLVQDRIAAGDDWCSADGERASPLVTLVAAAVDRRAATATGSSAELAASPLLDEVIRSAVRALLDGGLEPRLAALLREHAASEQLADPAAAVATPLAGPVDGAAHDALAARRRTLAVETANRIARQSFGAAAEHATAIDASSTGVASLLSSADRTEPPGVLVVDVVDGGDEHPPTVRVALARVSDAVRAALATGSVADLPVNKLVRVVDPLTGLASRRVLLTPDDQPAAPTRSLATDPLLAAALAADLAPLA